jgi:hypothetical protein
MVSIYIPSHATIPLSFIIFSYLLNRCSIWKFYVDRILDYGRKKAQLALHTKKIGQLEPWHGVEK